MTDQPPTDEERRKMALRECRRHLMKRTFQGAKTDILETIKYRKVSQLQSTMVTTTMIKSHLKSQSCRCDFIFFDLLRFSYRNVELT